MLPHNASFTVSHTPIKTTDYSDRYLKDFKDMSEFTVTDDNISRNHIFVRKNKKNRQNTITHVPMMDFSEESISH